MLRQRTLPIFREEEEKEEGLSKREVVVIDGFLPPHRPFLSFPSSSHLLRRLSNFFESVDGVYTPPGGKRGPSFAHGSLVGRPRNKASHTWGESFFV